MLPPDRLQLAQRIQGYGNYNPPPLEDENAGTVAKRAVGRIGDMVGEEVMLTVEDFREKGAVGAVKDAVADAGDILIDGVAAMVGWIRGDPPEEEDPDAAEVVSQKLSKGPAGAAYGISQASPTGGINAVWVMPEDADPAALAQLTGEGSLATQDRRVPRNIQPFEPQGNACSTSSSYQLPSAGWQPLQPGQTSFASPSSNTSTPSGAGAGASAGGSASQSLVDRVANGQVLPGTDVAKRLTQQCVTIDVSPQQLGVIICERIRRAYLGLDDDGQGDTDERIARLLRLVHALWQQNNHFGRSCAQAVKDGAGQELLSLRSSLAHRTDADILLRQLGLCEAAPMADLLGEEAERPTELSSGLAQSHAHVQEADLLGEESAYPAAEADLLGTDDPVTADLLGTQEQAAPKHGDDLLAGLNLDCESTPVPAVQASGPPPAMRAEAASSATGDAFSFVDTELHKANSR